MVFGGNRRRVQEVDVRITELIFKKKHGERLLESEIRQFVQGYISGEFPDYQVAALLMAIWFNGMSEAEIGALTMATIESGEKIDLSGIPGIKVDKHSTGGVGDTVTLIAAPLVASCGGRVAKMSGRGLGHTGGTLDKLESIPGFSVSQTKEEFERIVSDVGLAIVGQTGNLVPADKKLYALRDVTETVDCIPLIAASIMGKKIASGSDAIVLDVKTGNGAFMKEFDKSLSLANQMVKIGNSSGRTTMALITDMSQPLGNAVGNALEVREAIEILRGDYRGALAELSLATASWMLIVSGIADSEGGALDMLDSSLASGRGLDSLSRMIAAQGGDPRVTEDPGLLPTARREVAVTARRSGYVTSIDTEAIGMVAMLLGAGRVTKEDRIDPAVGLWMKKRLGDCISSQDTLAVLHVNDESNLDEAVQKLCDAIVIGDSPVDKPNLIHQIIDPKGNELL